MTMMMTESVGDPGSPGRHVPVAELARRQGVQPIRSAADLVCLDVFESDAEVDEFIEFVHTMRQAGIA